MTPAQMTNDLILGGWRPMRYTLSSGDVWVGVYHPDHGLVYMEIEPFGHTLGRCAIQLKEWPAFLPQNTPMAKYLSEFKCRWVDVEPFLAELYAKVTK